MRACQAHQISVRVNSGGLGELREFRGTSGLDDRAMLVDPAWDFGRGDEQKLGCPGQGCDEPFLRKIVESAHLNAGLNELHVSLVMADEGEDLGGTTRFFRASTTCQPKAPLAPVIACIVCPNSNS